MAIADAVTVKGIGELVEEKEAGYNIVSDELRAQEEADKPVWSSLSGHVKESFRINRDSRRNSLVEDEMNDSMQDFNGVYSAADLAQIRQQEQGSEIFMNMPATKCSALASWIKDIMINSNERTWDFNPTPLVELPQEMMLQIEQQVATEFQQHIEAKQAQKAFEYEQAMQKAQESGSPAPSSVSASYTLREINQIRRDLMDAVISEINREATYQNKLMVTQVEDQLAEGRWDDVLAEFVDYFSVYPTAFIKGPIITKKPKMKWAAGQPTLSADYYFENKCPCPLDIYPAPYAKEVDDGDFYEHMRYTRKELADMRDLPPEAGYKVDVINKILERAEINTEGYPSWLQDDIESDKADQEKRGSMTEANSNILHGLHGFCYIPVRILKQWEYMSEPLPSDDFAEMHVEVILVDEEVVKCKIIKDPMFRRPYYKASFKNIPGSFWGRSLPALMKDNTRMCNATARALANNMGIASGPQVEVVIDRLADDGEIEAMYPWKIWQTKPDLVGGQGRAVNFFQPQSNAQELLAVFKDYEEKTDDVTGVPKYAYGNENVGKALQTASGLSMLLESASKGVKAAIRNIDKGIVKPRIEAQFRWNLLKNKNFTFSGDINVVPKASSILTQKAAEQIRRNEFLQITANPVDQGIMGVAGRGALLREMSKDLGINEEIIPSRMEIIIADEKRQASAAQQAQMDQQMKLKQKELGLQATKEQIGGQERMHDKSLKFDGVELQLEAKKHQDNINLEIEKMRQQAYGTHRSLATSLEKQKMADTTKLTATNKELAFKLTTGKPGI